ncbi:YihY/virulence factor BrkB family protein [Jiulongibacter sediminis]|jgi:membrane protein|uniref:YihY/virulence factor BrkB family protein n=1 Tax=Jiulongibacter sediminis TaxID=1605367 RepID=UPI0026E930AE|nr:YihY/virulence factor BrkB family protein [Jiulongibacter sediminis]
MVRKLKPAFFWLALKNSILNFGEYKIPKKSASLAYYTTFALAPIFYLILTLGSLFYGEEILRGEVLTKLQDFVGLGIAETLQGMLSRTMIENQSQIGTVVSAGTLLVIATGVFVELQDSLNEIWSVEVKENSGFWSFIKDRLLSFSIILAFGFLLLVSMLINSAIDVLREKIEENLSAISALATFVVNNAVMIVIISALFYLIFRVLPDIKLSNRVASAGALLTTVLFLIGRYFIGLYLSKSNLNSIFGQGGTVVILLSWVYYTSIILYFGAAYTRNLALVAREPIGSKEHAEFIENQKVKISDSELN